MKKLYFLILFFCSATLFAQNMDESESSKFISPVSSEIQGFKMYPNPVSDGNLFIKTQRNDEKGIEIFDVLGKRVFSKKIIANYVNISNLTSGIYILKVTENSRTSTRKLVIK